MSGNESLDDVRRRFSRSGSAGKWHALYASETERLDEVNFRQRRDVAVAEVRKVAGPGTRVLDAGCGAGPVLAALRRHGIATVGVDCAPDMLDNARQRLRAAGLDDSDLHLGDVRNLPFADGSFDVVLSLGVISYLADYRPALREIARLLRPGGTALISYRNAFNPVLSDPVALARFGVRRLASPVLGKPRPQPFELGRFLDHREVEAEIATAGLTRVAFHGIGFGPLRLAGRPLLGERASIRLSARLDRLTAAFGLARLRCWATDVSLGVYRRPTV